MNTDKKSPSELGDYFTIAHAARWSPHHRLLLTIASFVLYPLVFFVLYPTLTIESILLGAIPIVVTAWFFGLWWGLLILLVTLLISLPLAMLAGETQDFWRFITSPRIVVEIMLLVGFGVLVARLREQTQQLQKLRTSHQGHEAEVAQSESSLLAAQQLARIGSWEWDIASNRVSWSDELYRIYGLQPQEAPMTYEGYLARVLPADRDMVNEVIQHALQDAKPFHFYERIVQPSQNIRTLYSRGQVNVNTKTGRPISMVGACQDVTETKQGETQVLRREGILYAVAFAAAQFLQPGAWMEKVEAVLANLGHAVDANEISLFENRQDEEGRILSSLRQQWIKRGYIPKTNRWDWQDFSLSEKGFARWESLLMQGESIHGVVENFPQGEKELLGVQTDEAIIVMPIFVGETWWGYIGVGYSQMDTLWSMAELEAFKTATRLLGAALYRQQAEEALHESQTMFQALITLAPDAILLIDENGHIILANQQAETMFGYVHNELLTRHIQGLIQELIPAYSGEIEGKQAQHEVAAPSIQRMGALADLLGTRGDGRRFPVDVTLSSLEIGKRNVLMVVVRDVTHRNQTVAEIRLQAARAHALVDIASRLNAQLDIESVLQTVCEEAIEALGVSVSTISLYDEAQQSFYYAWGSGVPADFSQRVQSFPFARNEPDSQLQSREGMVITDDVQALAALPNADLYAEMDLRTTINVLLQREGRLIGRLNIGTTGEPRQFSEEELAVLRGLADHAVTAIENARLYQESQRQAAMLEAVNKIIATIVLAPNLQSLLDTALTHILQALSLPIGIIWTSNRYATQGLRPDAISLIAHIVQGAEAALLPDVVAVTDRQQVTVDDPAYAFAHSVGRIGLTAAFFIPMLSNSWQLGGIIVGQSTPRVWNTDEIALMRAVGQQLNTAIERFYLRKREQDQARQVQQILEMAPEGMVLLDEEQRVILANPAGRKYLDLLGVGDANERLLHLGNEPIAAFLDLPSTPLAWHEVIIDTPQRHIFEIMARPLTDSPISEEGNSDDGQGYVLVLRDVTQERQRSDYLQTQERLATVGQLAAGIAHDFNNILTPILLYTDMSIGRTPEDSRIQASLQQVLIAANRAKDLIQQILAFGRHGTKQGRRVLHLQPIIKETLKLLRAVLPSTIEIEQGIAENVGPVLADATQIHQILMNLCTNAYHAMSARGGVLSVELDLVEIDTIFAAKQENLTPGSYVRLTVRDTGYGMDRAVLAHIFDPFFTTKPVGEGTGMGLSVVYGIVMEHQGAITVESQPGRGSTFRIYLAQMDEDVETEENREGQLVRGQERILVVDDEQTVAQVVKESLESIGYQVTICTDSTEALEIFRAAPKQFDLVMSDLTMPRMTGLELVRKIAAIHPHLPIILTSGYGSDLTAEITSELSVRAYLMKPFAQNILGQTIRQVLDRKN